ncbi:MAG: Tungsten transporter substrate-binding protein [Dehalococcoidia bacterium]|nr:Tungsten transporter substrate-binding protein [Dehalococcoidia bacterium]
MKVALHVYPRLQHRVGRPSESRHIGFLGTTLVVAFLMALTLLMVGCSSSATPVPLTPAPTATATPMPPKPANPELILSSTTSTRDSGLLDVLIPIFQQKTGYQVKPIYSGSGAAMALGQKGEADVLLVHAPDSEVTFMQGGYGISRRLVMHNDFIFVGPASDPAGIKGTTSALDAMKKLAATEVPFYSRGDDSGTDQLEKKLWRTAGITPDRAWYFEAGLGMGDLLRVASEKAAYTITDRATYLANQKTVSLDVLVQGDPSLLNVYHVIQVNPQLSTLINAEGARAFADFMVDPATQLLISKFGVDTYGQPLFFPDAGKTEAGLGSK